jgi:hypothetical protein
MGFVEFLKLLARSCCEGLRRNKLPACLSAIALVLSTALVLTSEYDERPRYRKVILPKIEKAEGQFFEIMREAEQQTNDTWRLLYFVEGHRRAKAALRIISSEHPMTAEGKKAQAELVRYYELVDEELAIIRTEMSLDDSFDYLGEWKRRNAELLPIREHWVSWLGSRI